MLLRTRISLLVILFLVVIIISIVLAAGVREDLIREQFSNVTILDRANLWRKVNDNLIQRMEDKAWVAAEDKELLEAVRTRDREAIRRHGTLIAKTLRNQGTADRFDVLYPDGTLAFSSQSSLFQSSVIANTIAQTAIRQNSRIRGIGNDRQRNVVVALGIPLSPAASTSGSAGLGVYAISINEALLAMEQATNSSVLVVNRRGRLLAGSAKSLWHDLDNQVDLTNTGTLATIRADDRVYSIAVLPQTADLGSLVARLVGIRDVTDSILRQERVSHIALGSVAAFLLLMLAGLSYYMARSFAPLTDGVEILDTLSHGDLQTRTNVVGVRDEVERIANAVDAFRTNLVAFDQFRRSRERQRRRQERFIRRELTQLADTLDEEERASVLAELDQLEQVVRECPANEDETMAIADATDRTANAIARESDSLAMTALAFQKMSGRIRSQNQSLREALAAKNAFIAVQKELDIATRVQLSLLPDAPLMSRVVDITGTTRPAKEIGGDFYDYFRLDQHHIGVTVADVSGKGVPAGLFMVMARTFMRATAAHYVHDPGIVLQKVGQFLEQNNSEGLFVTLFYGVLNELTGVFTYANGGHNPPILVGHGDATPLETTGGVALGMFSGLEYAVGMVDMDAGCRIILFSDGITDAVNEAEEIFGDERLRTAALTLPHGWAPDKDVNRIIAAVDEFVGEAPQFDDITCVVLIYKGRSRDAELLPDTVTDLN